MLHPLTTFVTLSSDETLPVDSLFFAAHDFNHDDIVLIIPGNPGLVLAYEEFAKRLHEDLEKRMNIAVIGHLGHSLDDPAGGRRVFTLAEQVDHKIAYVKVLSKQYKRLTLIGHSIGAWFCLKVLESNPNMEVVHTSLVFPTIERMSLAAGFKNYLVKPGSRHLLGMIWGTLGYTPEIVRKLFLRIAGERITDLTLQSFRRSLVMNMLSMANEEFAQVDDFNKVAPIITANLNQIFIAYSQFDEWVPMSYVDDCKKRFPKADIVVEETGVPHGFATNASHSMIMADLVSTRISPLLIPRNRK